MELLSGTHSSAANQAVHPRFIEPEGSSLYLQQPATFTYPEPDEASPRSSILIM